MKIITHALAPLLILVFPILLSAQPFHLPELGYPYHALEPHVDAQTMEIHHQRHHQAYVQNLNKALANTPMINWSMEDLLIGAGRRGDAIRNNGGGHYNHTLFWEILSPKPARHPGPALEKAINETFTSLDSVKTLLNKAAATRFGSGWAWLYVNTDNQLAVCSTPNQDNPIMDVSPCRGIPVLGIDVWEHAYYLRYQNKRGDYLTALWEVLDWSVVTAKYEAALRNPLLHRIARNAWEEMSAYQALFNQCYLPVNEGSLETLRLRSVELAGKARTLAESEIPGVLLPKNLRPQLERLAKDTQNLNFLVQNPEASEEQIIQSIHLVHSRLEELLAACDRP